MNITETDIENREHKDSKQIKARKESESSRGNKAVGEQKSGRRGVRFAIYLAGMVILAFGITLNTKTGLGVSPIISISYSVSEIWNLNFGNMTLILYSLFVGIQFLLRGKDCKWSDLLQIPVALLVSQLLNLFDWLLDIQLESFWLNLLLLIVAILLTGLGVVLSVDMRLVPNPGDGIVQAISDKTGKSLGFTKNIFDVCCIVISITLGLGMQGRLVGIGLGTVCAVLGVGRAVALFHQLLWGPMMKATGMLR